ncbi:MAG: dihydrofolate reductase [Acidobacteria bacterium]|nr:dihydrofolate reductase [Acidobacteriota bacterium]
MRVSLIAAVAGNGVIGIDNRLPWRLSADLRRFRRLTLGHWLLMGRKTYEGIGRPLPGREIVVLSRREGYAPVGVHVAGSLAEGLALARAGSIGATAGAAPRRPPAASPQGAGTPGAPEPEVFIAGGAEVYRQALALGVADRFWLTRIHRDFAGDVCLPEVDPGQWTLADEEHHGPDAEAPFAYSFLLYERLRRDAGRPGGEGAEKPALPAALGAAAGEPRR